MQAFLLEIMTGRAWRRDGQTFWTREAAVAEGERIIRRGKAVKVRVLLVEVGLESIQDVPPEKKGD